MVDRVADLRAALEGALRQKTEAEERAERMAWEMTKQVAEARRQMKERCAKVADEARGANRGNDLSASWIAAAIRALPEEE